MRQRGNTKRGAPFDTINEQNEHEDSDNDSYYTNIQSVANTRRNEATPRSGHYEDSER